MDKEHNREDRWFAYHLGELNRDESAEVEAEMADSPEEADAVRAAFEQTKEWATRPVAHTPLNLHDLPDPAPANVYKIQRWGSALRSRQGMLVAASIFVLALTQVQFSYSFNDSAFTWGAVSESALPPLSDSATPVYEPDDLAKRLEFLEQNVAETDRRIASLVRNANILAGMLDRKTTELALSQQLESQAWHQDMQRMIAWTGHPGYANAARISGTPQRDGAVLMPAVNPQ